MLLGEKSEENELKQSYVLGNEYLGLISETERESTARYFTYDARGQMVKITDQAGESETFRYDSEGNQISHVDRNGTKISMNYNMYGSLVRRTAIKAEAGGTSTEDKDLSRISESFFYYPDGILKTAIAGGMRYEYTYDVRGRLKSKSASGRELLSYGYDLNGNKISQRDVTGNVTEYRYGISDELLEIYDKGVLRASYEYNLDGTVKRQKTGKGTEILTDTCYAYDEDRNLTGLKTFLQGGWQKDYNTEAIPLVCNAYGYDRNGNRIFKETIGGRTEYEYDSRNRLEMVRYPDRWEKFGYDPAGNRKSRVTGEVEESYTYDVRNRLLQVVRTAGNGVTTLEEGIKAGTAEDGYGTVKATEEVWRYEYDRQGNLLKDNYAEYNYDGFNRMEKAETFTGKIQVNHYDAEGLRHEIEENGKLVSFIFSDREVVAESSKEDTIRYIRGYDILCSDSECARTYYHYVCDEGDSTSHILDETGKVLNQYEYDAFGNLIKAQEEVNNRFLYVGQQYDAITMQYYLRARYYNPVVARFTQEDTYRGDGLNLYAYCQNNPVGYYDPSGHSTDGCGIGKNGNSKSGSGSYSLLPGEGDIGTYRDLLDAGEVGDNITPHHMPSAEYMSQYGVGKKDGLCMNMEMPSPGTGGRHRLTDTYGRNMTDAEKAYYYSLLPRDALAYDIANMREIYQNQGLYSEIRPKLQEYIKQYKELMPELFDK